jgi:hypothetical protein
MMIERPLYLESTDSLTLYDDPNKDWWYRSDIGLNQMVLIPTGLALMAAAFYLSDIKPLYERLFYVAKCFCFGLIYWTFIEYFEHRFKMHNFNKIPEKFGLNEFNSFFYPHHVHHMFCN